MASIVKELGLNAEQTKAVFSARPKTLVLAGAGTGKTRVLTGRVCHLLETGASPRQIQVYTFTNKAAQELKRRLQALIPERANRLIGAGTFHSFCYRVLDEWAAKIGYRKGISILDEEDRMDIIHAVIEDLGYDKRKILRCIEEGKSTPELALVQDEYRYRIQSYNCVDFDLLQDFTIQLLENHPEALGHVRRRTRHILIDEFQDTDPTQARLVELLEPQTLFCVGDDWQAIYSFRGADFRILLGFKKRHPEADEVILPKNYRSTREIIEAANRLIPYNRERTEKSMAAADGKVGPVPLVKTHRSTHEEARWIAQTVKDLNEKGGIELKDIAILARTNEHIQTVIDNGLRPARIPVQAVTQERNAWNTAPARGFLHWFRALVNPRDYQAQAQILNWPFARVDKIAMAGLRRHMAVNDVDLYTAVRDRANALPDKTAATSFLEAFWHIQEIARLETPDVFSLGLLIDQKIGIQEKYHQRSLSSKLAQTEGFLHRLRIWVQERKQEEDVDAQALVAYAVGLSLQDTIRDDSQAVKAMTVHAAKGVEFPVVIVAGCTEGLFPHAKSLKEGNIEEERRLFYVACTRAMDRLILTRYEERSAEQFRPWDRPGLIEPSRFIAEALGTPQIH